MRKIIQIVTGQDLQCDLGHTLYALCSQRLTVTCFSMTQANLKWI